VTALTSDLPAASWRALGTGVRLIVVGGDLDVAKRAVEDVLDLVDRTYSRFRDDSELSELNDRAGQAVALSGLLADAIAAGLDAARRTRGAVDPTVGQAMRAIGYDVDFERLPANGQAIELRLEPIPGWQAVDLSPTRREVRIRPGVELDLGSTGKGLAADLAAATARDAIGGDASPESGVLVSLGGDIAMRGASPADGWRILIADDSETPTDAGGEVIAVDGGGVATSSTTVRRWRRGARTLHHLVDPRTGGPVDSPWRTASVVAATCLEANMAATAAIVLGDEAVGWLEGAGLPARLVSVDGAVTRLNGWPEPIPVVAGEPARNLRARNRIERSRR
jgi:FAD:protein FMN transferase